MKRQFNFCLLFLACAVICGFLACTSEIEKYIVGEEAEMTALRIGNVEIKSIPDPIDEMDYDDGNIVEASVAIAALERSSDTVNARFWPSVSKGARVLWGIGSQDIRPFVYYDLRVPANFEDADYIYFRVTSEDGEITNYYRFSSWVRSPVVGIVEAYIGKYDTHEEVNEQGNTVIVVDLDERMMATPPTGDTLVGNSNLATAVAASANALSIRENQSADADIIVVPADGNATLKYAVTNANTQVPALSSFSDTHNFSKLNDQTFFYVQVTAQNEVDINYYKFRIEVGRIATLTGLYLVGTINDPQEELTIENVGTPRATWAPVVPGSYRTADMPSDGFDLRWEQLDEQSVVTYALIDTMGSAENTVNFVSSGKLIFDGTKALAVRVVSQNGLDRRYYKVALELLAAVFKEHPKPNFYYYYDAACMVGTMSWYDYAAKTGVKENADNGNHPNFTAKGEGQVEPLDFELDRPGTYTYQWYEANSWYGGYGFDANGKILYYEPGNPIALTETGFIEDSYHVAHFDEKKNVSLHNGGNQFYRLPTKGRLIPGATGETYTPKIDFRPFIDGFTYESHYYWVVVTETTTGRTATSKRATIVSERDPTKRHHIVDLNRDLWREIDGEIVTGSARNQKPFTFQREKYSIPVTFPKGWDDQDFDIADYTVATVQALFWLRNGTQWIQNWTQGDIGFDNDQNQRIVYYYNLTNNNATLGLIGGGKEPGGGSLREIPAYLVVKPAGEKPVAQMPPFEADGVTPKPNDDAQGWFTAFIELVEVRFEGPPQPPLEVEP